MEGRKEGTKSWPGGGREGEGREREMEVIFTGI